MRGRVQTSATGALEFVTIRNRIEYNDVKALDVGAFFRGGPVPGSVIVHNRATRLMVDLAAGSTIEDNVINGSVSLSASTGLSFRGNTILGGGLNLDGVSSSVVWANVIRRAPADGISLTGPVVFDHDAFTTAHNLLLRNTVARSARNGIFLQATAPGSVGASGTVVRGNRVHDNGGDGIHVEAPSTTAVRNVANHNAGVGINAPPGIVDAGKRLGITSTLTATCETPASRGKSATAPTPNEDSTAAPISTAAGPPKSTSPRLPISTARWPPASSPGPRHQPISTTSPGGPDSANAPQKPLSESLRIDDVALPSRAAPTTP